MADARDEQVWTKHAEEHKAQWEPHEPNVASVELMFFNELREKLYKGTPLKFLDIGCGSALWRNVFPTDLFDYHGVDQNAKMIEYAKERFPEIDFRVANANELPYIDGEFDIIWTAAVIQHNTHEDKPPILKELHRILKPEGVYICTENSFRKDNYHHVFPSYNEEITDNYSFTLSGWEKYMKEHKFNMAKYKHPSYFMYEKI